MSLLAELIAALQALPSVGPKSAQRMVFHLLHGRRQAGFLIASKLESAMNQIGLCDQCNHFTEVALCSICANPARDQNLLCIVENSADLLAIEQSMHYQGRYFVLMGLVSPLNGIGPDDLNFDKLEDQIKTKAIKELILALSPSPEGETTVYFLKERLKAYDVHLSQLAQGIPSGGSLEFLDQNTINAALRNRAPLNA